VGWYRRTITVAAAPDGVEDRALILYFGAVDYQATVWVNGQWVDEHEGGYLPFEFEIGGLLQPGANDLVVRVADPTDSAARWPTSPFSKIPHGKQSWYGPIGGIWQRVWLEERNWL